MNTETHQVPTGPFKFLYQSSKPYKWPAFIALLSVTLASISGSLIPYILKRIVDSVGSVSGVGPEDVWFWAFFYVCIGFFNAMSWRGSGFAGMRWATGVRATGREMLTEYVTLHGHNFFSNRFAGAIGAKLKTASEGLKSMVESILWEWQGFIIKLFISFGLIFLTNAYIGWIFIVWLLFITPVNIMFVKKKIPLGMAGQESDTRLTARTVDVLTNINAVHDYARRPFEVDRLKESIDERRKAGMKNWTFSEWMLTANSFLETIFVAMVIFTTVYLWDKGTITPGDIILIITLVVSLRSDLAHLGGRFNSSAEIISQLKEGLTDILRPHEIVDEKNAETLEISKGEIVFKDLTFGYGDRPIFNHLDLTIKHGQRVGLVGKSGAGKSTLMKLLMRQFDPVGGVILIDGQDISKVKQESLRGSIAVVPQEPLLFHRSLEENIKYGSLSATNEEIVESAKHAQAHSFIESLPKKYETLVGERGIKLSGGERQRVAIARAFLKQAKILLLDEATSSLDSEGELLIREALDKLMEGKTVIAIAHRLSTLRAMDRILVMDGGRIVEDGTHNELLNSGGIYSELWSHQAGGFITEDV